MEKIRIGTGAGYGGDRIEPAVRLVEKGNLDYLIFECLAERTIANAQQIKMEDPDKGYNGFLEERMNAVLKKSFENGIKIVTNMGAANPEIALNVVKNIAKEQKLDGIKIAAVYGDDITENIEEYMDFELMNSDKKLNKLKGNIISANAYLGIEGILKALNDGADVIITGRVADPSLFLAPMVYEFDWELDNYNLLGQGTMIGHLLECAGQVTGGYFANPGYKDVSEPWDLGFPIGEVKANGEAVITKVKDSGGKVTKATCSEQLLYEIHDPSTYITPDCVADFTNVKFSKIDEDKIKVTGGKGKEKPKNLKVSIGYQDCYIGEGEISYGGSNSLEKSKLAKKIVEKRLEKRNIEYQEIRYDHIGFNSLYKNKISDNYKSSAPTEVRLRVAARTKNRSQAKKIGEEVQTLYTNGPAGGGGATKTVKEVLSIESILIPRENIDIEVVEKEVY